MIGTSLNQYRITASIGAGGMGEVFRARDTRLNRDVAVKVLPKDFAADPNRLRRFEQEAKSLASLNHPNVLTIHDAGVHDGAPYLVSELLEGQTLREVLASTALPVRKATEYALQIAHGLSAAHAKGIVHRDLKPENIFVTKDGRVKILDFGLAKLKENPKSEIRNPKSIEADAPTILQPTVKETTEPGKVMGTPNYMAPEQVRGEVVDHRADIFAFGCVLYEMLSGQRPFKRDTAIATMAAIMNDEPRDLADLNRDLAPAFARVVRRCLEKEPERRFQTASDLAFALENLQGSTASIQIKPLALRDRIFLSRWMLAGASAALGAVLAVFLFPFSIRNDRREAIARSHHVSIALPAGQTFLAHNRPMVAISPDGSRVVYSARATNGTLLLWEQRFDHPMPKPLRGTEGAKSPFFSPDSKSVGYALDHRHSIMKLSLEGGAPVRLCENMSASRGATWSRDGNIYFCPTWSEGIWKVKADGNSKPVQVLKTDPDKDDLALIWPHALPNGDTILITVWTGNTFDAAKVIAYSVRNGQRKEIFKGAQTACYAEPGHILFAREGSLYAVPFDGRRLERTGPEQLLAQGIEMGASEGDAQLSVSATGSLVYIPGKIQVRPTRPVWVDRQNISKTVSAAPLSIQSTSVMSVSPDGKTLGLSLVNESKVDVYTYDLLRGIANKLSAGGDDYWPVWTPDGKKLIFASGRLGGKSLYWRNADGSGPEEPLTSNEGIKVPTSVSTNGRTLLFQWKVHDSSSDVWTLSLDGADRKPRPLLTNSWNEFDAKFSPNGKSIAYTSDKSGQGEVYVTEYPGNGQGTRVSIDGGHYPVWSRDGQELFYASDQKMMVVESTSKESFHPGKPRELFECEFVNQFDVSPDGKEFLMLQPDVSAAVNRFNWVQDWTTLLSNGRAARKP